MDLSSPFDFREPGAAVAIRFADVSSTVATRDELLASLAKALEFPDYFGGNWDAFDECLGDLSWLPESVICIRHASLPNLPTDDLEVYLDILAGAVRSSRTHASRVLAVCFPPSTRDAVSRVAHASQRRVSLRAKDVNARLQGYTDVVALEFSSDITSGRCDLVLQLSRSAPGGPSLIWAHFEDVSHLTLTELGGGLTQLLCLRVTDVSAEQLDRVAFRVEDLERGAIRFDCLKAEVKT